MAAISIMQVGIVANFMEHFPIENNFQEQFQ